VSNNATQARAIAAKINKDFKDEHLVVVASDIEPEHAAPRITSGIIGLDVALNGGFPANRWTEIVGEESSGKTALTLKMVAANQARDPEWVCAWVAAEPFVADYAAQIGCDLSRIWLIDTNIMEEAYNVSLKYLESRNIDCLVIDSLPALTPDPEVERDMEDSLPGLAARLNNKFFRKARKAMKRSLIEYDRPITGVVINQWRDKIGVMYGDPRTTPGGKGKNFEFFIRMEVARGDWIKDDSLKDYSGKSPRPLQIGQELRYRIFKNKVGAPQRGGVVDYYFYDGVFKGKEHEAGEFDTIKEVVAIGRSMGVIFHRGGGNFEFGEDHKWRGEKNMIADIEDSPELAEAIMDEIRQVIERSRLKVAARKERDE